MTLLSLRFMNICVKITWFYSFCIQNEFKINVFILDKLKKNKNIK